MAREYTNKILEMLDEGMFDKDMLIRDLLSWMSEKDVREFADVYQFFVDEEIEEDLDEKTLDEEGN